MLSRFVKADAIVATRLLLNQTGMKRNRHTTILAAALLLGAAATFVLPGSASSTSAGLPDSMPAPAPRPSASEMVASVSNVPSPRPSQIRTEPMTGGLPGGEHACRARLVALGVSFEAVPEIDGEGECGIPYPIEVTSLGADVDLQPEGVMNCATAEAAARLIAETAQPAARRAFDETITSVRHASAYVCRMRASGEKISEHARGNALDISAFVLADGRIVEVREHDETREPEEKRFLRTIRKAACGPFKTVLGPGTDADHATHFHFDLAERRSGSTYCR